MNLALYIYLCDVVSSLSIMFAVLAAVVGFVLFMALPASDGDILKWKPYWFFWSLPPVFVLFSCLMPSQKTMYAMAAAYYGEQAVKSDTFQKLNGKAMKLLEVKIDELIGEEKK